jgi:hypothetical protein
MTGMIRMTSVHIPYFLSQFLSFEGGKCSVHSPPVLCSIKMAKRVKSPHRVWDINERKLLLFGMHELHPLLTC